MISTSRRLVGLLLLGQLAACSLGPGTNQETALSGLEAGVDGAQSTNPYLQDREPVPRRAREEFDRAVQAMEDKRWPDAEAALLQLTGDYPQLSGPWLNLGIVYQAGERDDEARTAYARAIEVNGHNLEAYNRLAALERAAGAFEQAELLYLKALSIWPDHANSHLNLGVLYDIYLGRFEQAAVHYSAYQALQDEPDRRVAGWLADLERRPQMLARSQTSP